jgi:septation ring formation regulator EzrA
VEALRRELQEHIQIQSSEYDAKLQSHRIEVQTSINRIESESKTILDTLSTMKQSLETLSSISAAVDALEKQIDNISGKLTNWDSALNARDDQVKSLDSRLSEQDKSLASLWSKVGILDNGLLTMRNQVFGDPSHKTPLPSLSSMITDIHKAIPTITTQMGKNTQDIRDLMVREKARAEKWANRRKLLKGIARAVFTSKSLWIKLMLSVGGASIAGGVILALFGGNS